MSSTRLNGDVIRIGVNDQFGGYNVSHPRTCFINMAVARGAPWAAKARRDLLLI